MVVAKGHANGLPRKASFRKKIVQSQNRQNGFFAGFIDHTKFPHRLLEMYMTFLAGSPCEKTVSFALNLATVLPRPAESRNDFTSNAGLDLAFLGEQRTLMDTPRAGDGNMQDNSIEPDLEDCSILHSKAATLYSFCVGLAVTVRV